MLQGNKMDSSNLATLFAPNILHAVRPGGGSGGVGGDGQSTMEMAQQAEEVISVVRAMIDHNKALFEVSRATGGRQGVVWGCRGKKNRVMVKGWKRRTQKMRRKEMEGTEKNVEKEERRAEN